jgi:hypothetical protein
MQDFTSLEIELLKFGYRKIYFLETECITCGTWRIAQDAIFERAISVPSCPQCSRRVEPSPILALGFTRRETPFHERIKAPLSVNALAWINARVDDDERDLRRIRKEKKRGTRSPHNAHSKLRDPVAGDFIGVPR